MNRGRGKRWIFHGTPYYEAFLKTLEESHQRYDAKFHAYLFDGKSLPSTGGDTAGNLDRIMRHINGVYTQRHNRFNRTDEKHRGLFFKALNPKRNTGTYMDPHSVKQ